MTKMINDVTGGLPGGHVSCSRRGPRNRG